MTEAFSLLCKGFCVHSQILACCQTGNSEYPLCTGRGTGCGGCADMCVLFTVTNCGL